MDELLNHLEKELKILTKTKEQSNALEIEKITKPFNALTVAIEEYNAAATAIINNNLRRKAIEWKERERQINLNIKSLSTLAFNTFGIYDIALIQRAVNENPKWYQQLNFERRRWNNLGDEIKHKTDLKSQGLKTTDYSDIAAWEEARELKLAQYDELFEMFKNQIEDFEKN